MQSAYYQNDGQDSRGGTTGRTLMACIECRKKKKKCDGSIPCQRCIKKTLRCVKTPVGQENYDSSLPAPPVNTYPPRVELHHKPDLNPHLVLAHPYQDPAQISGMTYQFPQQNPMSASGDAAYTVDANDQYYLSPAQQAMPHLDFPPQQPAVSVSYLYAHSGVSQSTQDLSGDVPDLSYTPSANHQYTDGGAGEISDSDIDNMRMQGLGQDRY